MVSALTVFFVPVLNYLSETTSANSGNWWQHWADSDVLETIALQNAPDAPPAPSDNFHHSGLIVVPEHSNTNAFTLPVLHQSASLNAPVSNLVSTEPTNVQLPVFHTATAPFASHAPSPIPASVSTSVQQPASNTSPAICAPLGSPGLDNSVFNPTAASRLAPPPQTLSLFSRPVTPQSQLQGLGTVTSVAPPLPVPAPAALHANVPAQPTPETTPTNPQLPVLNAPARAPSNPLSSSQSFDISTPLPFISRWPSVNSQQSRGRKNMKKELAKENMDPSSNNNARGNNTVAGPIGARPTGVPLQDLSGNGAQTVGPNEVRPAPLRDVPSNDAPAHGPNEGWPILPPPVPTPAQGDHVRRSNRAPIPTTRLDRQNEIGTNIVPPKPPVDATAVIEEPLWFAPAYDYLKNNALGTMWVDLVEKWAEYERAKTWKTAKVC